MFDVIIIGAGPAGIAAARSLHETSIATGHTITTCLLEGRNRVGGRAYTDYSMNQPIDLGASWIHHYCNTNPVAQLAAKHIKRKLGPSSDNQSINQSNETNSINNQTSDHITSAGSICSMENAPSVLCGLVDAVIDGRAVRFTGSEGLGGGSGRFLLFDHDGVRIPVDVYRDAVNSFNHLMEYSDEQAAELRSKVHIPHVIDEIQNKSVNHDQRMQILAEHYESHSKDASAIDCSVAKLIETKRSDLIADYHAIHQSIDKTNQFERVLDFLISGCEQFEGESIDLMSAGYWQAGEASSVECDRLVQNGYGALIKDLSEEYDLDIRFRHVVRKIDSSEPDHVRIYVDIEDDTESVVQSVVLTARRVLVTVPLGVLKRGKISFTPDIPSWKQLAIDHAGFGLMNKIVMQFDKPFWGEDTLSIGRTDASARGKYRWFLSLRPSLMLSKATLDSHPHHTYPANTDSPNILVCFSTAQTGIAIENSLTDEQIVGECMQVLRECFGHPNNQPNKQSTSDATEIVITDDDTDLGTSTELLSSTPLAFLQTADDIPNPTRSTVTRWWADRFAFGSYSHFAYGANDWTPAMLAAPIIDGRVRFAGEHTNEASIGCVDSAFESGLREAQCIVKSMHETLN